MNYPPPFPVGEPRFIGQLRTKKLPTVRWVTREASSDEVDLRQGIHLTQKFPDPENLLSTATNELLELFGNAGIESGKGVLVKTRANPEYNGETFSMEVSAAGVTLEADTIEGIRRAVYYFENEFISNGGLVKFGKTVRRCHIATRISRCFFGPVKRPPHNIDELTNDIDYYPDTYLACLAREGVNGLWLTVAFREICRTSFLPEDPLAEKRLAKLRQTVEKCRRYGIGIWVFCIEPAHWNPSNPCPDCAQEMKGPEILGMDGMSQYFCPDSPSAQKYLYECGNSLFSDVPHLGGLITISHGERLTSCLSDLNATADSRRNACPGRCNFGVGEILSKILTPLTYGIHDANPNAGIISWLYMPQQWQLDNWIYSLPTELDSNVTLAFNFESGVMKKQLGIVRCGGDYWLAATGPSERFGRIAEVCRGRCGLAAKIQACSSHELSTLPYIPVPGLLYRKYKAMRELGVSSVIQCWYFGNYPGTMNQAAGWLAFTDFETENEDIFLARLAKTTWPECAEEIAQAWRIFAEAYSHYPLDIAFQYYGPVQDGPVWPLHLKQCMESLPRTWQPDAAPAGDVIAECLRNHTLAEAASLLRRAARESGNALEIIRECAAYPGVTEAQCQELSLCEAFALLLDSGANILEFYLVREQLFASPPDALKRLDRLEKIVFAEIENSRRLENLCLTDPRLGYHSESEVYKFYPEKLRWRISRLEKLLETEFAEVRTGLKDGVKSATLIAKSLSQEYSTGVQYESGSMKWRLDPDGCNLILTLECNGRPGEMNEMLGVQFCDRTGTRRPGWFQLDRWIANGSKPNFFDCGNASAFSVVDHVSSYTAIFRIPRLNFGSPFWFSIRRERLFKDRHILECCPDDGIENPGSRLEQLFFHPEHMILVRIKE